MAVSIPRRLRAVLDAELDFITCDALDALIGLREDTDLEVKSACYARSDKGTRELALDVAAMANASGGLLVIGMTETGDVIDGISPVVVADDELLRIRQVLNSRIEPFVEVSIHVVDCDSDASAILIASPASPLAPHAVKEGVTRRYVKRIGAERVHLSEADVARAYRQRFELDASRSEAVAARFASIVHQPLSDNYAWLVLAAVPDVPGHLQVTAAELAGFRNWVTAEASSGPNKPFSGAGHTGAGVRRLVASDRSISETGLTITSTYMEAHTDGSFASALNVGWIWQRDVEGIDELQPLVVGDETFAMTLIGNIQAAARHAARTGAGGDLTLLVGIVNPTGERLIAVGNQRNNFGFYDRSSGTRLVEEVERSAHLVSIDESVEIGPKLVATTWRVGSDLMAGFGMPELPQFSPNGQIRIRYFRTDGQSVVRRFAVDYSIDVVDDMIS